MTEPFEACIYVHTSESENKEDWQTKISDVVILVFGKYGIETRTNARILIKNTNIYGPTTFRANPLLWIGFKIFERRFKKTRNIQNFPISDEFTLFSWKSPEEDV